MLLSNRGETRIVNRLIFAALTALLYLPSHAWAGEAMDKHQKYSEQNNALRQFCILPEGAGVVKSPPPDPSDCSMEPPKYSWAKQITLKRPGSKCCVAVLQVETDGTVELNPKGFNYGPIPSLKDITPDQADELWASSGNLRRQSSVRTYKLESYREPNVAFIDLKFHGKKLLKYRIRSTELSSSVWHQV